MRAVYIVDRVSDAKVLVDPMRRAILNLLREKPMTQAQLAEELGLSNASLNYHMKILHRHKLVDVTKSVAEEHGIIQKFFSSAAYLFVYDLDSLPKDVARYFYPVGLERARTLISALMIDTKSSSFSSAKRTLNRGDIDDVSASLSRLLVSVARQYVRQRASYGNESIVYEIYTKVFNLFLKQQELPAGSTSSKRHGRH
jgi:DNA-binding transcriptional ArsR family regulator